MVHACVHTWCIYCILPTLLSSGGYPSEAMRGHATALDVQRQLFESGWVCRSGEHLEFVSGSRRGLYGLCGVGCKETHTCFIISILVLTRWSHSPPPLKNELRYVPVPSEGRACSILLDLDDCSVPFAPRF